MIFKSTPVIPTGVYPHMPIPLGLIPGPKFTKIGDDLLRISCQISSPCTTDDGDIHCKTFADKHTNSK